MKKFYITTSIAYTNDFPHLGFALESIQADVLARYHRLLGEEVFFLTGTDEHGRKVAQAAEKVGKSPKEFCDEISAKFRDLKKILNLSNDDFIRTTDKKCHWPAVRKVWLKLKENGDLYKKRYKGPYCVGCEAFITKKDLVNGKCRIHQEVPQVVEEENYFFRLSKYQEEIKKILEEERIKLVPETRKKEMLAFLKEGLEDISFSRPRKDLKWGIPLPDDPTQTIYCWADALTNYISAIGYLKETKKFKKFWPADIHCIGKDIQKFHSLIWPAMLLSLGLPLPKTIFVHGFITVGGQKMSKSLGNVIRPFSLVEKYGTDPVRYFLLREIPPTQDGDFTYEKFEQRYNADLAAGIGNLVARVVSLAAKSISSSFLIPEQIQDPNFKKEINKTWENYKKALDKFEFNKALINIWDLISFCDRYIEKKQPWRLLSNSKSQIPNPKLREIISNLLFTLKNIAQMLQPFLPETSEKILKELKTKKSEVLFPRI